MAADQPGRDQPCCDDGPVGHTEQEHHDQSPCYDRTCPLAHPFGGPFPHPCDPEPTSLVEVPDPTSKQTSPFVGGSCARPGCDMPIPPMRLPVDCCCLSCYEVVHGPGVPDDLNALRSRADKIAERVPDDVEKYLP